MGGSCQCWVALLRRCTQPTTLCAIPDSQADFRAPFLRFQTSCNSGSGGSQRQTPAGHCALCYAVTARPFANEQYAFRPRAVWQRVAAVCFSILFSRGLHTLTRKLHKRQIAALFCLVTRFAGIFKSERKVLKNKNSTDNRYPLVELKILTKQAANPSGGLSYYRNQRLQTKIVGVYW